jgi:hypothetical protein
MMKFDVFLGTPAEFCVLVKSEHSNIKCIRKVLYNSLEAWEKPFLIPENNDQAICVNAM